LVVVDPCLPRPTPCCAQLAALTTAQIQARVRMLDGNIRALNTESSRLDHERKVNEARLKENVEKIKLNKQLPYLISNVVEVGLRGSSSDVPWSAGNHRPQVADDYA
jgi:hypothetical protein